MQSSMEDGGGRKKKKELFIYLFIWYHLPVPPPTMALQSPWSRLTGLNCSLSKPAPAVLPQMGPQQGCWLLHLPLTFISPQTENSLVALVCGCLYTRFNYTIYTSCHTV